MKVSKQHKSKPGQQSLFAAAERARVCQDCGGIVPESAPGEVLLLPCECDPFDLTEFKPADPPRVSPAESDEDLSPSDRLANWAWGWMVDYAWENVLRNPERSRLAWAITDLLEDDTE